MPLPTRLISMALRAAELVCACVVAGIIGSYLHAFDDTNSSPAKRFIYVEVIASISILLSLIWLFPFTAHLLHWPMDLLFAAAWFVAFGLLVNYLDYNDCGSSAFNWGGITHDGGCNRWSASEAFTFISAICWLLSAIVGFWFARRLKENTAVATNNTGNNRRRWFGQSKV